MATTYTMSRTPGDYDAAMRLLRKIGDENVPGTVSCNDVLYSQRERLIGMIAIGLQKNDPGAVRVAPMVVREDTPTSLIARRIAWIVFQVQFPMTMRWAVHRDPFYADTSIHLLPDATRAAIQTYQAAAERRYRGFIQKARSDMKTEKKPCQLDDPFVNPLSGKTLIDHHSSPTESSSSSHKSSSIPMINRNFRTTRGVTVATAPPTSESPGFILRRRV